MIGATLPCSLSSLTMSLPKVALITGLSSHLSRVPGTRLAESSLVGRRAKNSSNLDFDRKSAHIAPLVEHLIHYWYYTANVIDTNNTYLAMFTT